MLSSNASWRPDLREIRIFSRNEKKQDLRKHYDDLKLKSDLG